MTRQFLSLVLLAVALALPASADAGWKPQMSGDPSIDAQWRAQLARPPVAGANPPIDLRGRAAPAPRRATPTVSRTPAPAPKPRVMDPAFLPATVDYPTDQAKGTIVIDPHSRYLYLVLGDGKAKRYGVGVGRDGFGWSGNVKISRKAEWPSWTPPAEMRKRQPGLPITMAGGPDNPLGARALYLYRGGKDTLYRIHGSNEPWTIGRAVSSGCFRMRNEDVIDLYGRVGVGTKVVVL